MRWFKTKKWFKPSFSKYSIIVSYYRRTSYWQYTLRVHFCYERGYLDIRQLLAQHSSHVSSKSKRRRMKWSQSNKSVCIPTIVRFRAAQVYFPSSCVVFLGETTGSFRVYSQNGWKSSTATWNWQLKQPHRCLELIEGLVGTCQGSFSRKIKFVWRQLFAQRVKTPCLIAGLGQNRCYLRGNFDSYILPIHLVILISKWFQ